MGSSYIDSTPTPSPLSITTGDVALRRGGGTICKDFRFLRCAARVAMCHFDPTTGVVTGDSDLGVGEFGDRFPDLRLPVGQWSS